MRPKISHDTSPKDCLLKKVSTNTAVIIDGISKLLCSYLSHAELRKLQCPSPSQNSNSLATLSEKKISLLRVTPQPRFWTMNQKTTLRSSLSTRFDVILTLCSLRHVFLALSLLKLDEITESEQVTSVIFVYRRRKLNKRQVYCRATSLAPEQILAWQVCHSLYCTLSPLRAFRQGLSQLYEQIGKREELLNTLETLARLHHRA